MLNVIIPTIAPIIRDVLSSIFPSKEKASAAEKKILDALYQFDAQQVSVNKIEAAHPSLFVAGWRPAIGWICALSIAWVFILHPLLSWLHATGISSIQPPQLHTDYLIELVMAMLGLSGLRSFEKLKGIARTR